MNRIYRLVWNRALRVLQVASELSHNTTGANAKTLPKTTRHRLLPLALATLLAVGFNTGVHAQSAITLNVGTVTDLQNAIGTINGNPQGAYILNFTSSVTLPGSTALTQINSQSSVTINGNGMTLDGSGAAEGFYVTSGAISINQLTIAHMKAQGETSLAGGGGAGFGGGIFIGSAAQVTLTDVSFSGNTASGGSSSGSTSNFGSGFNGGRLNGRFGTGGAVGSAGSGTNPTGGAGGAGSFGSGGGIGGNPNFSTPAGNGGAGGAGGFGGGGGGGGSATSNDGTLGYGGQGGAGGFGGGNGAAAGNISTAGYTSSVGGGGGGAGMGGAIFVQSGGVLVINGSTSLSGGAVNGGTGSFGSGNGSAFGSGIFLQGSGSLTFAPAAGSIQSVGDNIADQSGSGGTGSNAGSYSLIKNGTGTLVLGGDNTYSGGISINAGTVSVSSDANLGAYGGTVSLNGGMLENTTALATSRSITLGSNGGTLQADDNLILFGAVNGSGALQVIGNGNVSFDNTVTAASVRTNTAGGIVLSGDVTTTGAQTYGNPVNIGNDIVLTSTDGGAIDFGSTLDGAYNLIVNTSGQSTFGGAVGGGTALASLTTSAAGNTTLNGNVTTTGAQTYNDAVTLGGNDTLSGSNVSLPAGIAGGGYSLAIFGNATLGTATGLSSLAVSGTSQLNGNVTTTGTQAYIGAVTLSGNTTLASTGGGSIALGDVAMPYNLTVFSSSPDSSITGVMSGSGSLTQAGGGTLTLSAISTYTGITTISAGTLALSGDGSIASSRWVEDEGNFDISGTQAGTSIAALWGSGEVQLGQRSLTLTNSNPNTVFSGAIHGSGGVALSGGVLSLSGVSDYDDGTSINGPYNTALVVLATGALGSGPVSVGGATDTSPTNTLAFYGGSAASPTSAGSLTIAVNGNSDLNFGQYSSAGNATINNNGVSAITSFYSGSDAGSATIDNTGQASAIVFQGSSAGNAIISNIGQGQYTARITFDDDYSSNSASSVGHASIINSNGGATYLYGHTDAGSATLTNLAGGIIQFQASSSADQATVVNNAGGEVDVLYRDAAATDFSIGSLSGDGNVKLGNALDASYNSVPIALTLGALDRDDVIGGAISDSDGNGGSYADALTKIGSGTLTLNGASTYTGLTDVQAGTLIVGDSAHASASITGNAQVEAGATIGGHGSIGGNLDVLAGAHLAPGDSIGTLTIGGNASFAQGSVLDFEFGAPGATFQTAGTGDSVKVGGNLELDGSTLNVTDAGGFGPGLYNLFTYGGTLTETNGGITLGTAPTGGTLSIQDLTASKQINLLNTSGLTLNFWNANGLASTTQMGGGNGSWSTTSLNWTDANGSVTSIMSPQPGFAIFAGAAGTVTVNDGAGAVSALGLQFASTGYTLAGDTLTLVGSNGIAPIVRVGDGSAAGASYIATISNVLAGTDGLTKADLGTLVLTGANTYSGGTTISAGTLQGDSTSLQGNITDNAALVFNQNSTGTFAGAVSGSGTLTMSGSGVLTLTGTNAYTGGTTISSGSLQGDTSSLQGNITNNATLVFNQNSAGTFAGAVSGSGSLTMSGSGVLTLTGANVYTGGTTISAGTLQGDTTSLQGNITNNAALVFNQSADGLFAGAVSGSGSLTKAGAGTLILTGASTYTGGTTITAGTLEVGDANTPTAFLGGDVTVASNGTLRGHGTIGGSVVNNGNLHPGGSIGTLTIQGDYTQNVNSMLSIDAQPDGQASQLVVNGKATILGGSAVVLAQSGNWAPQTSYSILTAAGGISGQFASASSSLTFLDPVLTYGANAVNLSLQRNDISFVSVAQTRNQRATAIAADGLGFGSRVYTALTTLDAPIAQHAYDQLSGVIHASTTTALVDDSRYVRDAINRHLLGVDNNGTEGTTDQGVSVWTSAWGHGGHDNSDGNAPTLQANGSGLLLGADLPVAGTTRLGAVIGYGQNSIQSNSVGSDAHVLGDHAGLYGSSTFGAFVLRAGAVYSWQDIHTNRSVAFGNYSNWLSSENHAQTAQVYVDGGYQFTVSPGQQLEPFVNLARVYVHNDAVQEGGGAAALAVAGNSASVNTATLGLRDTLTLDAAAGIRAHISLGWQQAWGDLTPLSTMRFASGGGSFAIAGAPLARHVVTADLGIDFKLAKNVTFDASYLGQFASGAQDQGARMSLTLTF